MGDIAVWGNYINSCHGSDGEGLLYIQLMQHHFHRVMMCELSHFQDTEKSSLSYVELFKSSRNLFTLTIRAIIFYFNFHVWEILLCITDVLYINIKGKPGKVK